MVAGGGRDLTWPVERVAAHLLEVSRGRLVQALFHGAARGADQAIAAAAEQLGWRSGPARRNGIAMAAQPVRSGIG